MARLLLVHHTPSPAMHAMLLEAIAGANDPAIGGVDVVLRPALTATAVDVLEADGYLLGTPVNLGYISGALKHFFDQIYYPCLDATKGRPFGAYLHAPKPGDEQANGLLVLTLTGDRIQAMTRFTSGVLPKFGLPPT